LSIISASGLVMITIYNLLVDANSWGSNIPASVQTARDYYRQVDPRHFFQITVLTFIYFVPRDMIIFTSPIKNTVQIKTALFQWKQMNWIRSFLGIAGVLCTCKGLDTVYKLQSQR
jgi:hypothetical protein